jgi:hypothetical protein
MPEAKMDGRLSNFGVDSLALVDAGRRDKVIKFFGAAPNFWGRYFTAPGDSDYDPKKENAILNKNGICVLPLGRQTPNVNKAEKIGTADGKSNVAALLKAFPASFLKQQGNGFYMFLDVEGDPHLSVDYWKGWHKGVKEGGAGLILPCIYATQGDTETWTALAEAAKAGAPPHAAWVAAWGQGHQPKPLPAKWDKDRVTPDVKLPCPVVVWQYQDGPDFDGDLINMSLKDDQLEPLGILPPDK